MIELDGIIAEKIKNLKMEFKDEPQPELLIKIPNRSLEVEYEVEIVTSEFTSLCPLNLSQPDYATIYISYTPKEWCVELKSLKFYLVSFRLVPVFHEQIPPLILCNLLELLQPKRLLVHGQFTTRGGLDTTVRAVYPSKEVEDV